jgi:integrase/recombinase XerD
VSTLRRAAEDYLAMRRSLGYKLQRQGPLLLDFAGYLEQAGATTVTIEAAIAWATLPATAAPVWWKHRLSVVRGFAAHLKTLDPSCQVPPPGLLPAAPERSMPYLYSPDEIAALVHAAGTLTRRLTGDDVDLDTALIAVINSKFGKSRLVPLHPATVEMLHRYAARRDHLCPAPATSRFFISAAGTTLLISSVDTIFARLLGLAGIRTPPGRPRPRVHDLRHSMAVETLLEWYRSGADVRARLPLLSTWLGHADPASTFWYLHACPELLALAARLLENSPERAS